MGNSRREGAFSLVELIVVVAIVGIIVSAIVPRLGGTVSSWRSDRYAQSVWSSLRNAKFQSVAKDRNIVARFKLDGDQTVRFYISETEADSSYESAPNLYPMDIPEAVRIASVGTEDPDDDAGYNCIEFETDGTITEARAVTDSTMGCKGKGTGVGKPIIHIAPQGIDLTSENECLVSSIILDQTHPNAQPYLVNFGAGDEFSNSLGDEPCR